MCSDLVPLKCCAVSTMTEPLPFASTVNMPLGGAPAVWLSQSSQNLAVTPWQVLPAVTVGVSPAEPSVIVPPSEPPAAASTPAPPVAVCPPVPTTPPEPALAPPEPVDAPPVPT